MSSSIELQVTQDAAGGGAGGSKAPIARDRRLSVAEMSQAPGSYELTRSGIRGWKIFRFLASPERVMFDTLTNAEIHERLAAQWGAVGVIAALIGGIAYGAISQAPPGMTAGFWTSAYGFCTTMAAAATIGSSLVCMFFFMALNAGPEATARSFLDYFLLLLPVPLLMLMGGFLCLCFSAVIQVKFQYPDLYLFWIVYGCIVAVAAVLALYYMVHGSKVVARGQYQSKLKPS